MLTGNKGEWSEIYTFLRLLGDTILYAGDNNLNKIEKLYYPIVNILRQEHSGIYEYEVAETESSGKKIIIESKADGCLLELPVERFSHYADLLLNVIKNDKNRTFGSEDVESFLKEINCYTLKAKSEDKADIHITLHDMRVGIDQLVGFSIKSHIGGSSTLLNTSAATNIVYDVKDCDLTEDEIAAINAIDTKRKILDRLEEIRRRGGRLSFNRFDNIIFESNLINVDSCLPRILSYSVLDYYLSSRKMISEITESVRARNPLQFKLNDEYNFYENKIKHLLTDVALGMVPASKWDGHYDATGGMLIVKEDGNVLCYHVYNKNKFEDYLYNSTFMDTPSSTRYGFGKLYKDKSGALLFDLNFQIRFAK